jgi:hypothetical protein
MEPTAVVAVAMSFVLCCPRRSETSGNISRGSIGVLGGTAGRMPTWNLRASMYGVSPSLGPLTHDRQAGQATEESGG